MLTVIIHKLWNILTSTPLLKFKYTYIYIYIIIHIRCIWIDLFNLFSSKLLRKNNTLLWNFKDFYNTKHIVHIFMISALSQSEQKIIQDLLLNPVCQSEAQLNEMVTEWEKATEKQNSHSKELVHCPFFPCLLEPTR